MSFCLLIFFSSSSQVFQGNLNQRLNQQINRLKSENESLRAKIGDLINCSSSTEQQVLIFFNPQCLPTNSLCTSLPFFHRKH